MNLTGKVFDQFKRTMGGGYEGIPSVQVFISDSEGNITSSKKGTVTDKDGNYSIPVQVIYTPSALGPIPVPVLDGKFITAKFGSTVKTLPLTNSTKYDFDIGFKQGVQEVGEVTFTYTKPLPDKKKNTGLLIGVGIAVLLVAGLVVYKNMK